MCYGCFEDTAYYFTYKSRSADSWSDGCNDYVYAYGDGYEGGGTGMCDRFYPHKHNDRLGHFIFGRGYINDEPFDTAVVFI